MLCASLHDDPTDEGPRYLSVLRKGVSKVGGGKTRQQYFAIPTVALVIMIAGMFVEQRCGDGSTEEGRSLKHPILAFMHFLRVYSDFDWSVYALGLEGKVDLRAKAAEAKGVERSARYALAQELRRKALRGAGAVAVPVGGIDAYGGLSCGGRRETAKTEGGMEGCVVWRTDEEIEQTPLMISCLSSIPSIAFRFPYQTLQCSGPVQ